MTDSACEAINSVRIEQVGLADKEKERKRGWEKKDWPHLQSLKGFSSPLISVAVLGDRDREGEGATGTCNGALAKSPIITSKLDSAGGGLSDTGAPWRMKHCTEIGAESLLPLSAFPRFPSIIPPAPFTVPHFLSVIYLVLPSLSLPFPPPLLLPPCVLSLPLTPGCLDGEPYMRSFSFPLPSWLNFSILSGL